MKKLGITAGGLFVAYGIIRLIDGANGDRGPGLAWSSGHLLFLVGLLLFGAVVVLARRSLVRRRPLATTAAVVGLIGIAAFVRVIVVDLIVGFRAENHADMSRVRLEYGGWPGDLGIYDLLETLGPILFLAGLLTLAVLLTLEGQLTFWSPVLLLAGFIMISAQLDLMPLGGAMLGAAFAISSTTGSRDRRRTSAASSRPT